MREAVRDRDPCPVAAYGEWRMSSPQVWFIFAGSRAGRAAPLPPAGRTDKRNPPGGRALASCPRNCAVDLTADHPPGAESGGWRRLRDAGTDATVAVAADIAA